MLDDNRQPATLRPDDPRNLLSREARIRLDDAIDQGNAEVDEAIAKIDRRLADREWDELANKQLAAADKKFALVYLTALVREFMNVGKSGNWLREVVEDELSAWDGKLSQLEKRAVMAKLRTVRLPSRREPAIGKQTPKDRSKGGPAGRSKGGRPKGKSIDDKLFAELERIRGTRPYTVVANRIGISPDQYSRARKSRRVSENALRKMKQFIEAEHQQNMRKRDARKPR